MQIIVKILGGQECQVEVASTTLIIDLKKELSVKMKIPVESQKLVFKGKTMLDASKVGEHPLEEGAKVHLVVSKGPVASSSKSPSTGATSSQDDGFWNTMRTILKRHFTNDDVEKILKEYQSEFEVGLQSLNLDDIERMAHNILEGQKSPSNQTV